MHVKVTKYRLIEISCCCQRYREVCNDDVDMIWPPSDSYLGIREYPDNGDITDDDDDEDNNNESTCVVCHVHTFL